MPWYAVQTYGGNEEKSRLKIEKAYPHYRTLLPFRVLEIRAKGRTRQVKKPLFNGYIFVETPEPIDLITSYEIVNSARNLGLQTGALKMPGAMVMKESIGSDPVLQVDPEEMQVILQLTEKGEEIGFSEYVREEGRVKILRGALKGLEAVIRKVIPRKKRIEVEFELFGKKQRIQLGAREVDYL